MADWDDIHTNPKTFNWDFQQDILAATPGYNLTEDELNAVKHAGVSAVLTDVAGYGAAATVGSLNEIAQDVIGFFAANPNVYDDDRDLVNNEIGRVFAQQNPGLTAGDYYRAMADLVKSGSLVTDPDFALPDLGGSGRIQAIRKRDYLDELVASALLQNGAGVLEPTVAFPDGTEYSFKDGDPGDNVIGDGYAYDYTRDLPDYDDGDDDRPSGPPLTSPRPKPRPDDLMDRYQPVVLDLDGDGVEMSIGAPVFFDTDEDGYQEHLSGWAAPDDGFLVVDLLADGQIDGAGDGVIDQGRELAFSLWGDEGMTDLEALAEARDADGNRIFDSNGDGVLNAQDTIWGAMKVWQDLDQDGETDAGELKTLDELGITSINLTYDDGTSFDDESNDVTIFGNTLYGLASYVRNGETIKGGVGDIALLYAKEGWREADTGGGYRIEFENGEELVFAEMDGTGGPDVDLSAQGLDGAFGDARHNVLRAGDVYTDVRLSGGGGGDLLVGGWGADFLSGDAGADRLRGGAGDDVLFFDAADTEVAGGGGYDAAIAVSDAGVTVDAGANSLETVHGTDTADTLTGASAARSVSLHGKGGDDTLTGGRFDDILSGDDGNDVLSGGNGSDLLFGGAGDDLLSAGHGDDFLSGGAGSDTLDGQRGDDLLFGDAGSDLIHGGAHDDYLDGGSGDDSLHGDDGDDMIFGQDGDDRIWGGQGDDDIRGGRGNDTIHTGSGDDHVLSEDGNDTIHINSWGDKHVRAGTGNDNIYVPIESSDFVQHEISGEKGWDTLHLEGNRADYSLDYMRDGNKGINQYNLKGLSNNQLLLIQDIEKIVFGDGEQLLLEHRDQNANNFGNFISEFMWPWRPYGDWVGSSDHEDVESFAGDDVLLSGDPRNPNTRRDQDAHLGSGDDQAFMDVGNDTAVGWTGNDILSGGDGRDRLEGQTGDDGLAGGSGNDTLRGDEGSDFLDGGDGTDVIEAGSGSDLLRGGRGNDTLYGRSGGDFLYGNEGNDRLEGGWGSDYLDGGVGNDTLVGGDGADVLKGSDGIDTLSGENGNDTLEGGDQDDTLTGGQGHDLLMGGNGDDTLHGQRDSDQLVGGNGNDLLYGGVDADWLYGDAGRDRLEGGDGNDFLDGGRHNDTLLGGQGNDVLLGSAGVDVLRGEDGYDWLEGGDGGDRLIGGAGNDFLEGGAGADFLDGGEGDMDIASYRRADAGVEVDLLAGIARGEGVGHSFSDHELWEGNHTWGFWDAQDWLIGDFNGDGQDDVLSVYGNMDGLTQGVYLSQGNGFSNASGWQGNSTWGYWDNQDWLIGDFNGDGQDDVLSVYGNMDGLTQRVYLSQGNGFSNASGWQSNSTWGYWDAQEWHIGDFNNDGRDDVLSVYGGAGGLTHRVYLSEESGFSDVMEWTGPSTWAFHDGSHWFVGDFDGDGNDDNVSIYKHEGGVRKRVYLSETETLRSIEGVEGSSHADILFGGDQNESLFGNEGDDTLDGRSGDDRLDGGRGSDALAGGSGADVFVFRAGDGADTVSDFENGIDIIEFDIEDLSADDVTIRDIGAGAEVTYDDAGSIVLEGIAANELSESVFAFV